MSDMGQRYIAASDVDPAMYMRGFSRRIPKAGVLGSGTLEAAVVGPVGKVLNSRRVRSDYITRGDGATIAED